MATVEIPNPHFAAEVTDNSKTDESIQHTTVNVGPGGTVQ